MTSREIVNATLDFQGPERIPFDLWALPAARMGREARFDALVSKYTQDFYHPPYDDPFFHPGTYTRGSYVDVWGSEWHVLQEGMIGEVKRVPLDDYDQMAQYHWPFDLLGPGFDDTAAGIAANQDKYILGGWVRPWEQMQFLRGPENLYADLADDECSAVYELRDRVFEFFHRYIELWLRFDVDAIVFGDDWGSQRSLLISPATWRAFFRPKYQELFDLVRNAGKRVFFHSDGHIAAIYPDFIEMGVSALNSQVWCMGLETVAPYAGQITFWGELDRQHMLPYGTPNEIRHAAQQMIAHLYKNGGLIGEGEIDHLTSLENIEALCSAWSV